MKRFYRQFPDLHTQKDLLQQQHQSLPFSYQEIGQSRTAAPKGYDWDVNEIQLGWGRATFETACQAMSEWKMFPAPWTRIFPAEPQEKGRDVLVWFHLFGGWWHNGCRVVYTIREENRFGFAYGTLVNHVESGEEKFEIQHRSDDSVWYQIHAFSRPQFWMARMVYPLARSFQRRFVRDSFQRMRSIVNHPKKQEWQQKAFYP
jgi:uncharacterized protein (UPF0548 family)